MAYCGSTARCKRDALPTELSARPSGNRGFSGFPTPVNEHGNGTERGQSEHFGLESPEIVPKRSRDGQITPGMRLSPSTEIRRGQRLSPLTEFRPGERRSPTTEFRPGGDAHNRLPVGSVRVRVETHTGLSRAWVKVAEPDVWRKRAVIVWEREHGLLPRGSVVHHRDRDSLNDEISNLEAMTRSQHAAEHREELSAWRN